MTERNPSINNINDSRAELEGVFKGSIKGVMADMDPLLEKR
jgi:hypothetical protein